MLKRSLLFALALVLTRPALAHKLKVFATAEGARIQGSTYFAGGGVASGARIEVRNAQGDVLATLTPDAQGTFAYTATAPVDHVLVASSADGHQAQWTVKAAELAGGFAASAPAPVAPTRVDPAAQAANPSDAQSAARPEGQPGAAAKLTVAVQLDPAALRAIEALVARQIGPLREELNAAQDRARLHDILGGIGYIFGLAGLALWWDARRRHTDQGRPR